MSTMRTDYVAYLASPEWRARRQAALARAGHRCQVCGVDKWFARLQVHHNSYERLGDESPRDLVVLCRHCHDLFHRSGKIR